MRALAYSSPEGLPVPAAPWLRAWCTVQRGIGGGDEVKGPPGAWEMVPVVQARATSDVVERSTWYMVRGDKARWARSVWASACLAGSSRG